MPTGADPHLSQVSALPAANRVCNPEVLPWAWSYFLWVRLPPTSDGTVNHLSFSARELEPHLLLTGAVPSTPKGGFATSFPQLLLPTNDSYYRRFMPLPNGPGLWSGGWHGPGHLSHPSWPALSRAQLASAPWLRAGRLWQAAGLGWASWHWAQLKWLSWACSWAQHSVAQLVNSGLSCHAS